MSKLLVRPFSFFTLLAIVFSQVIPIVPVVAATYGANGKIAVYKTGDIWLVDEGGNNWQQITSDAGIEWSPSWSSDGSQIAYACDVNKICIINKDGTGMQQLAIGSVVQWVDWKPDEDKLLYQKNGDLWRIDTDGSNATKLTNNGTIQLGRYSSDGAKIVYADANGITTVNSDGTAPNVLTTGATDESPSWSPDGLKIIFTRDVSGSGDIFVMESADGGLQTNITNTVGIDDHEASWSPDGQRIVIAKGDGLWVADSDGSNGTKISGDTVRVPAWQPINKFVVNSPSDEGDVAPGDGICETSTPGECTLHAAIQETNALTTATGTLTIELDCDLTVESDLPQFTNTTVDKVILEGYGYTLDGAGAYTLIDVAAGAKVEIEELTISNGLNINGGAVYNEGQLDLVNIIFKDNSANNGGAIYNSTSGSLYVVNTVFKKNMATAGYGGAISNEGDAVVVNSTFSENHASQGGGGFANLGSATADLLHVTMVGNQSDTVQGGGFAAIDSSDADLINSIVSGNLASGAGGGPEIFKDSSAVITSSHNLFGTNSQTTSQAIGGFFSPDPSDLLATSDGTDPTPLTGILNTFLSVGTSGNTAFYRLVYGSPAIDAADSAACSASPVNGFDQRDLSRPVGAACDIGSYEADINIFVVTNINDSGAGSLRQAITDANSATNAVAGMDQIQFAIVGAPPHIISPTSALPAITDTVGMDGMGTVVLYGANAGPSADGLTLNSNYSVIQHLTVKYFHGAGIVVTGGSGNIVTQNSLYNNDVIDLDLGDDGVTFNHDGVIAGPNGYQNYPVLELATSEAGTLRLVGYLESDANSSYTINVYKNLTCHSTFFGGGQDYIGGFHINTDGSGLVRFDETMSVGLMEPQGVSITATGNQGTSEFSFCRAVSTPNLNWAQAQSVLSGSSTQQYMTDNFQEKWFKVAVQPGSTITVKLTNQPGSALSLHTDPNLIYDALIEPEEDDEIALSAASANAAFLPSGSLPSGSLPSGSLPSGSLPSGSLPSGYLPSGSLPSGSLPSGSLPSGSLPFGALPSGSLPSGSLPSGSLPSGSLPSGSLPSGSLPSGSLPSGSLPSGSLPSGSLPSGSLAAYAMAARRSLIGISMNPFRTEHTIKRNTYDYLGDLYIRVVGPYDLSNLFTLDVQVQGGVCSAITAVPGSYEIINGAGPTAGTLKTLLLTDSDRLTGTPAEITLALTKLQTLAARPEVEGEVINLADAKYERVVWANTQADANLACPTAKNIVADEIKNVIDVYWEANSSSLEYIVLAGGASVIPYYQVQDVAEMANEKEYIVPVAPSTASEAGLATNLVQGQDGYGSSSEFTQAGFTLPFPDLAVGRLVDEASDITNVVNAYIATGGVIQPASSLVTGYDFVGDGAEAVKDELEAGTSTTAATLIQPPGEAPDGPNAWSATDLSTALLAGYHGVVSLSGHFSAGDLLAADYSSQLSAASLGISSVDLTDTLVLTLGCHGGYTIPKDDLLTGASPNPDWAKAILRKDAAGYIAATGYAYGDTELVEYGERLFLLLSQQLRTGTGQIAIGHALMEAKRQYLAETTQLTGIDQKTITEMTLYGLPMMKVDMPGSRLSDGGSSGSVVTSTTPASSGPGASQELSYSSTISFNPLVTEHTFQLKNLATNTQITTRYYSGADGVVSNPYEPIYPKQIYEVQAANKVLRGVALRGGTYTDQNGIIPLTTSPAIETTNAHKSFNSSVFYPTQTWMPNYTDAINDGITSLMLFPVQYRSSSPGSITGSFRIFTQLNLQFFYLSDDWSSANTRAAAVSAAPSILGASAAEDDGDVTFSANVTADGSAGVQAVWVLYTGKTGSPYYGTWTALDLTQDPDDTDTWTGTFTPNGNPDDLVFMVQAVGGAGLTTLDTNKGSFYSVAAEDLTPPTPVATTLSFTTPPTAGVYSEDVEFTVHLDAGGNPLADKLVTLDLGGQQTLATTDSNGDATVSLAIQVAPGSYTVQAAFDGDEENLASTTTTAFTVSKDTVSLSLVTSPNVVATIKNSSNYALVGKAVIFVIHNGSNTYVRSVNSNFAGKAALGKVPLQAGTYTIDVYFSGTISAGSNTLTLTDAYFQSASLLNAGSITSTAPSINVTAKKADNTPYTAGTWTKQTVTVHYECSDSDGVASCPADQVYSTDGTFTASGTATDMAGDSANASFGLVKIDKTVPTLAPVISPKPIYLKRVTTASPGATDSGGSGIATKSCGVVSTATLGTKTVTCTATDNAGNVKTVSVPYTVIYRFVGFARPVYNLPSLNQMKVGRGVQIRFSLNGNQGSNIFAAGYPKSAVIACSGTIHNINTVTAPATSNLKYTSTNKLYTYTWKTLPSWAGTCRQLIVKFKDGRVYRLNFKFVP